MRIAYLDGHRFREFVIAGADWVRFRRDYINSINVFPVADGDTGTNMALSLSATATAVRGQRSRHLGEMARIAAEASLLGAKGNSGVIMAHWFLGLAASVGDRARLSATEAAGCLTRATERVYAAMERPVEGTIISVMRAVSDHASLVAAGDADIADLAEEAVAAGSEALARTPEQLAVLREAHVVDAGAQGFVDFLQGVARALRGEPVPQQSADQLAEAFAHSDHNAEDISERFCTEIIVRGRRFEEARLKRSFRDFGSSLLVATTGTVFKLHIHTNHPDDVLRLAGRLGEVVERKVDDMRRQRDERGGAGIMPLVPLEDQPAHLAVLCDSTADLPSEIRARHGIELVPLQVLFGDRVFRDQVDLDTEGFYARLASDPHHPSTSQPPPSAFVEALDRIRKDREAVVLTISSGLSGTYKSALDGARLAGHKRIEVFDSACASLGLGMMTLNAARLAERGASVGEILTWLERWRADTGLVFTVATLEYLRRGGRIGAAKSLLGNLLGVRPVLAFEGNMLVPIAQVRGREENYARMIEELDARLPERSRVRLGLVEIGSVPEVDRIAAHLARRCEVIETVRGTPTGVIGAHAGPGGWGVFYQLVRDDDPLAPR
ncbi:MAG: DegV family protein [Cucumibacter sp.]